MKKRRCSLCGGKLVNNKCVECGLDNSKSDVCYQKNESRCNYEPLTHVHEKREEKRSYIPLKKENSLFRNRFRNKQQRTIKKHTIKKGNV